MKLGIAFANSGPLAQSALAVAFARAAEAAGVESVWTVEHVVVPTGYESVYPYSKGGRMSGEDLDIPDPLVWLAWVGAATERLLLGTGILILPQRNPVITAKATATLAAMSGGRLRLGVGIGWLREEFDALGVPFEGRGARAEEWVAAMRTLWAEDDPSFEGELIRFRGARMWPKPPGRSIPVIVGGDSDGAARRAGRVGDGYYPARGTSEELARRIAIMRDTAAAAGRDPDAIELTASGRATRETAERYRALGITRLITAVPTYEPDRWAEALGAAVEAVAGV